MHQIIRKCNKARSILRALSQEKEEMKNEKETLFTYILICIYE